MSKVLFLLFITVTFLTTLFFSKVPNDNNLANGSLVKSNETRQENDILSEMVFPDRSDTCIFPEFEIVGDHFIKVNETKTYEIKSSDPSITYFWNLTNDNSGANARIFSLPPTGESINVWGGTVAGGRFWLYAVGTNNCGSRTDQGSVYIIPSNSPVDMLTFNTVTDKNIVKLNWSTENELNNSGFEVERRSILTGAEEWQKIGFVEGSGTTIMPVNYSFTDSKANSGKYTYRLKQIDLNGNSVYFELDNEIVLGIPEKFSLSQNYPNPFNPSTKIVFDLPVSGNVKLTVFDNLGREVKTLINEFREAGNYKEIFNASSLSSGTYFYRLEAGKNVETKKMMLVK